MDSTHFLMVEQPKGRFFPGQIPYLILVLLAILLAFQIESQEILIALLPRLDRKGKRRDNSMLCLGFLVECLDALSKASAEENIERNHQSIMDDHPLERQKHRFT